MSSEIFNFSAGPAMLPREVMLQASAEFLNYQGMSVSAMEISHRGAAFAEIAETATQDLRDVLSVPDNYHLLFLAGGATAQCAAIPLNLLDQYPSVAYVQTGHWGRKAALEAARFAPVDLVANTESTGFTDIPQQTHWRDFSNAAYLHYVDNETLNGVEFSHVPDAGDVPLVCDMSSNLMSRPIDVSRFGVVYACAQKNAGIAGVCIVIVREDLLRRKAMSTTPSVLNYALQAQNNSMLNTPPTYPWYMAGLVFQWVKRQGGVLEMEKRSQKKSQRLYDYIDTQDFYTNKITKQYRSRMNVTFYLPSAALDLTFSTQAEENGLLFLKGHNTVGGIRASIYNAMPLEGVDRLIAFMKDFVKKYG